MAATSTLERAADVGPSAPADGQTAALGSRVGGSGLGWVFTAFFGVFGWATGLSKLSDNSFFWHLRTG